MSASEQVENLLDEWEELLDGNPSADLAAFIARHAGNLDEESAADFRAKAEALAAMNRRLDALQDSDGVLSDTSDASCDSLAPSQLHEGLEPIPGYTLVTKLGSGGFGEVWKATAPGDFPVALKFVRLDGRSGEIERRSLEVMRDVRHPHLLSIFGTWQRADLLIIATELADRTLLDRHKEAVTTGNQGIPRQELLEYMAEAAKGIDFLNETGASGRPKIQHRDIKPQNLLLSGGSVKVGDFGLARAFQFDVTGHTGSLTLAYAAPEFLDGKTSSRSDQYSLAVTYCFLRSGRLPFEGTQIQVIEGHRKGNPDLSMLPDAERPVVARALSKKHRKRWSSCREFVEMLRSSVASPLEDSSSGDGKTRQQSGSLSKSARPILLRSSWAAAAALAKGAARRPQWIASVVLILGLVAALIVILRATDARLKVLNERIEANPQDHTALIDRAELLLEQGKWQKAVDDATDAILLDSQNSRYFLLRGQCYLRGNRRQVAIADLSDAIRLDPSLADAYAARARARDDLNQHDDALKDANEAIRLDPENAQLLTLRGRVLAKMEQWDEALADLGESLRLDPGNPEAKASRACVLGKLGHMTRAMAEAAEVVRDHPDLARGHRATGMLYGLQGKFTEAIASLTEAIRLEPNDSHNHAIRGTTHLYAGNFNEALEDFNQALGLDPEDLGALLGRAQARYELGFYREGYEDCTNAIYLKADDPSLYRIRSQCALEFGQLKAAIDDATIALERVPDDAYALGVRANAYLRLNLADNAITDATAAIELDPTESYFYLIRAAAYEEAGRQTDAEADRRQGERLMQSGEQIECN